MVLDTNFRFFCVKIYMHAAYFSIEFVFILKIFICPYCFPVGSLDTARLGCIAQCCYLSFRRLKFQEEGWEFILCVSQRQYYVQTLSHLDGIALPELFADWLIDKWH